MTSKFLKYQDISGTNINDVCDELEILGCTDPDAQNYNPNATDSCDDCCVTSVEYSIDLHYILLDNL